MKEEKRMEELVDEYFDHIGALRSGKEGSVVNLMDMWDEDGVLEFVGSPPVTGTYKGRVAIHTLYKNRLHSSGMQVALERDDATKKDREQTELAVVDTRVERTRTTGPNHIVAGWSTTIGTADGRGFEVPGSHQFTFKNGKIASLKIVVSPRPGQARDFDLEGLSVQDVGRLALAAWPVV